MPSGQTPATLQEPAATTHRNVALFTYVVGYDDLCAVDLADPVRLDAPALPIVLARATTERAVAHRGSRIVVPDPWMSSCHASIERRGATHVLRDGGSRNGTFVNGEPVTEHPLENGDLVEVGHSLFCYRLLSETSAKALLETTTPIQVGPTRTRSPEMAQLVSALARVAASNESVLLLGETGTGKEVLAEAVHVLSGRRGELRAVHCGAVPGDLFESTLFGHVRGAFTGATEPREGEIARCHGGTLFLDEVATMAPACQAKLLRVLEDGLVTKVGGARAERFDVRWVAATNADLFADDAGFRPDLLRRLSSYVARLPRLRDRREDLGALTAHVLREKGITKASISAPAARRFFSGNFPGNIRDLRRLRSAAMLADGSSIEQHHLPPEEPPKQADAPPLASPPPPGGTPVGGRKEPQAADVARALERSGGNVVHAARILGTHPRQIYRWIKRFSLSLDPFRR